MKERRTENPGLLFISFHFCFVWFDSVAPRSGPGVRLLLHRPGFYFQTDFCGNVRFELLQYFIALYSV